MMAVRTHYRCLLTFNISNNENVRKMIWHRCKFWLPFSPFFIRLVRRFSSCIMHYTWGETTLLWFNFKLHIPFAHWHSWSSCRTFYFGKKAEVEVTRDLFIYALSALWIEWVESLIKYMDFMRDGERGTVNGANV